MKIQISASELFDAIDDDAGRALNVSPANRTKMETLVLRMHNLISELDTETPVILEGSEILAFGICKGTGLHAWKLSAPKTFKIFEASGAHGERRVEVYGGRGGKVAEGTEEEMIKFVEEHGIDSTKLLRQYA